MIMVKLTKTSRYHTQKNLCFLIQNSNTQVDDVFIVGAAILEWPVLILSHGACVGDIGLSLANFPILSSSSGIILILNPKRPKIKLEMYLLELIYF